MIFIHIRKKIAPVYWSFVIGICGVPVNAFAQKDFLNQDSITVQKILVEGTSVSGEKIVLSKLGVRENIPFFQKDLSGAIKRIYQTGKFEDVEILLREDSLKNNILVVRIKERLKISHIEFVGNQAVWENKLLETLPFDVLDYYDPSLVNISINAIKDIYKTEGFLLTKIDFSSKINEEKKTIYLRYEIQEGPLMSVGTVRFYGNEKIASSKLKTALLLKEDKWFRDVKYDEQKFAMDKNRIIAFYKTSGYLDAKIARSRISYTWKNARYKRNRAVHLEFWLEEGPVYYFGNIVTKGNQLFNEKELLKNIRRKPGEIFNNSTHERDVIGVSLFYNTRGYLSTRVTDVPTYNEDKTVDYVLDIYEGKRAHIERIFIEGNYKTKSKTLLNRLEMQEGEIFIAEKLQRSIEKLYETRFIESVEHVLRAGSAEGLVNITFKVKELTSTLNVLFGVRVSPATYEFSGEGSVVDVNFLGKGYTLGSSLRMGVRDQNIDIRFTNPRLNGFPLVLTTSLDFSLYDGDLPTKKIVKEIKEIDPYTREIKTKYITDNFSIPLEGRHGMWKETISYRNFSTSAGVSLGYTFARFNHATASISFNSMYRFFDDWGTLSYRFSRVETQYKTWEKHLDKFNVGIDTKLVNYFILGGSISRDTRDSLIFPSRGGDVGLSMDILCLDYQAIRWKFFLSHNVKIFWRVVLSGSLSATTFSSIFGLPKLVGFDSYLRLPFYTLRGWRQDVTKAHRNGIFAQNSYYQEEDLLYKGHARGLSSTIKKLELNIPLLPRVIQLVKFVEAGNISAKSLDEKKTWGLLYNPLYWMYSFGFGLAIEQQAFPIGLYFAWRFGYDFEKKSFGLFGYDEGNFSPEIVFTMAHMRF